MVELFLILMDKVLDVITAGRWTKSQGNKRPAFRIMRGKEG